MRGGKLAQSIRGAPAPRIEITARRGSRNFQLSSYQMTLWTFLSLIVFCTCRKIYDQARRTLLKVIVEDDNNVLTIWPLITRTPSEARV